MITRMKKYAKTALASFLALVLILSVIVQPNVFVNASSGYTEMEFADWGTAMGTDAGLNIYSLTDSNVISSLDGVAISGTVNFNGTEWQQLVIGGKDGALSGGFMLIGRSHGWSMATQWIGINNVSWSDFTDAACKTNGEVLLRMTFDKADNSNDWTVKVYADGTKVGEVTYQGVTPGLYIGISPNVTVDMTPSTNDTYTEMTFGDWGTAKGTDDGLNIYSLTDNDKITSLDGVAINGTINFNGAAWKRLVIGGKDGALSGGFMLITPGNGWSMATQWIGINTVSWTDFTNEACKIDGDVLLRMTFNKAKSTDDWTINIYADGNHVGTVTYQGVTPGLYIGIDPAITVDMTSASTPTYTEKAFSDWGKYEGDFYGFDVFSLTDKTAITSLDGVAVSGKVNFNGDTAFFRFGGTDSVPHGGFSLKTNEGRLVLVPEGIGPEMAHVVVESAEWSTLKNTEFTLRLIFVKDATTSKWSVEVCVNGTSKGVFDCGTVQPGLYLANSGVTIDGVAVPPPAPTYTEKAFSDWGKYEGDFYGFDVFSLTDKTSITSLDGVAVSGTVNFNNDASFFRIGGTDAVPHGGFSLKTNENRLILIPEGIGPETAHVVVESAEWSTLKNTDFTLRLIFVQDPSTLKWSVEVCINGTSKGVFDCGAVTPGLSLANSGVTIDGVVVPPPAPTYTEKAFSDWGKSEGNFYGFDVFSLTDATAITSLDGVAVSGNVNFNGDTAFFRFGGTDSVPHGGFSLKTNENRLVLVPEGIGPETAHVVVESAEWSTLKNTEFTLRLIFVKDAGTSKWSIEVCVNGTSKGVFDCGTVTPGLYLANSGVTIEGVVVPPPAPTYTEKAFSDWGISEGNLYGFEIYSLTDKTSISSLDGVAVSGKVNFNDDTSFFRIGGTDAVPHGGFSLKTNENRLILIPEGIGPEAAHVVVEATEWATLKNKDITLRLVFVKDTNTSKWSVEVCIDGTSKGVFDCGTVAPGLSLANSGVTIDGIGKDTVIPTYTEMTFGDWGLSEGDLYGFSIYKLTNSDAITSLDGVAISGKIDFKGDNAAVLRIGGTSDVKQGGFSLSTNENRLVLSPEGIGSGNAHIVLESADWAAIKDAEFNLRIVFTKNTSTSEWMVEVHINGGVIGKFNCGPVSPGLYIATSGVDAEDIGKDTVVPTYKEMKFSDWGVKEGTSWIFDVFSLTNKKAIKSLDGVAINGKVNFKGNTSAYFRVGGTKLVKHAGFSVMTQEESGRLILWPQGIGGEENAHVILEAAEWATLIEQEMDFRMQFTKDTTTADWFVEISINGTVTGNYNCGQVEPGLYIANLNVNIEGLKGETVKEPIFPNKYVELAFADFGIYAGVMEGMDVYALKDRLDITSLDGVAISGKVNYHDILNGRISVGGTDVLKHAGFWLFNDGENLRLSPQGIGDVSLDYFLMWKDQWSPLKNRKIDLRMTFNKDSKTGEWWVGIYIDGEKVGIYNCGIVTPGLYIGINPKVSVDGLGDAVKYGGIDFKLWGYTKKTWREEMGLK